MNQVNLQSAARTRMLTRVAMLSVMAAILMYFKAPVVFVAPSFMKVDISDVPILLGAFSMGPVYGIVIAGLKNMLHLLLEGSDTGCVGELSNFIVSSTFAVVASLLYRRHRTFKGAMIALTFGVLAMTALAMASNYFFIFPIYSNFMPMEAIINMGHAITSRITDLWSMMIYAVLPFNLLKGFITSAVTMLLYKKLSPILKG